MKPALLFTRCNVNLLLTPDLNVVQVLTIVIVVIVVIVVDIVCVLLLGNTAQYQ